MSLQRSLIARDHRPILDRLPSRIRFATGTGANAASQMPRVAQDGYGSSLCENAREQRMRRIVFSLFLFQLRLPVLFFSYST
jgi:hypothetical protein